MTDERPTPETDAVDGKPTWQADIVEVGWVQSDFARCLERERDDALRKLESLEESITSLDHPNIRILLRQAESYALDVAEKHEKRYCEIKKQLADSNVHLENITIERDSERALADRLGNALEKIPWTFAGREEQASEEWNALTAWKEARSEV